MKRKKYVTNDRKFTVISGYTLSDDSDSPTEVTYTINGTVKTSDKAIQKVHHFDPYFMTNEEPECHTEKMCVPVEIFDAISKDEVTADTFTNLSFAIDAIKKLATTYNIDLNSINA